VKKESQSSAPSREKDRETPRESGRDARRESSRDPERESPPGSMRESSGSMRDSPPGSLRESSLVRRHLRIGWLAILVFLSLGIVLEALHGFKVDAYLNVANETRRLMWTLAHAHGVLIGVLHLGFAFTLRELDAPSTGWPRIVSSCLSGATVLLPCGFLLGGVVTYGGDPGRGILLVPVGAVLLFTAVLITLVQAQKSGKRGG
jgi:hypothetical protein